MNKYKEAIKLVLEFLDPDKQLCPEPAGGQEALIRYVLVRELQEWAEWITEDDEPQT